MSSIVTIGAEIFDHRFQFYNFQLVNNTSWYGSAGRIIVRHFASLTQIIRSVYQISMPSIATPTHCFWVYSYWILNVWVSLLRAWIFGIWVLQHHFRLYLYTKCRTQYVTVALHYSPDVALCKLGPLINSKCINSSLMKTLDIWTFNSSIWSCTPLLESFLA